jgi:hypothetical protein
MIFPQLSISMRATPKPAATTALTALVTSVWRKVEGVRAMAQIQGTGGQAGGRRSGLRRPNTSHAVEVSGSTKVLKCLLVPAVPAGTRGFLKIARTGGRSHRRVCCFSSLIFSLEAGTVGTVGIESLFQLAKRHQHGQSGWVGSVPSGSSSGSHTRGCAT